MNKILTGVIAVSMVLSFVAPVAAGAQAMTAYTFSTNLTVGSRGADVVALQSWLESKGYLVIPAGVSKGYFGALSKNALAAYQSAKGISPAAGYFGPITRAAVNAEGGSTTTTTTTTTTTCPAGYTCTPAAGTTTVVTSTPGAEGLLNVQLAATPANNANIQTNTDVPVYGLQFKANNAPVTVQTVTFQIAETISGAAENPATLINTIKVWDGSNVIATLPVTTATFVKDQNQVYYVQIPGLNFVVPQGTTKILTVSFSTNSIDSNRALTLVGYGASSIRAVSGNNVSTFYDFSGSGFTRTHTFKKPGTSVLTLSASGSPLRSQNYQIQTTNGAQNVPLLLFNLKSDTGDSQILTVYATTTASGTAPTTLYLYDGSTLLGSQTVTGSGTGIAFNNLTDIIPVNTIKTFTITGDFPSTATNGSFSSTTVSTNLTYQYPNGSTASVSGSAVTGVNQYLFIAAPQFALVGTPSTTIISNTTGSTTSMTATFTFNVTAHGANMTQPTGSNFVVKYATSTVSTDQYTAPSVSVTTIPNNNIGDGSTAQVTVTASVPTSSASSTGAIASGLYTFYVYSIAWNLGTSTTQTWGLDDFKVATAVNFVK